MGGAQRYPITPPVRRWVSRSLSSGRPMAGPVGSTHPTILRFCLPLLFRHARACPGHPRLCPTLARKTWMAGSSPANDGVTEQHQTEKWRRGEHRSAIAFSPVEMIRWSELHGHAGIDGRFGAGVGALAGCCDGADAGHCVVIEAELVLPVAVGNPEVDEVGVLRADEGLGGVEGQTDRFRVELGLGGGAEPSGTGKSRKAVRVALGSIPAGAAADREVLHVLGQEAEVHVVVDFNRPASVVLHVAVS